MKTNDPFLLALTAPRSDLELRVDALLSAVLAGNNGWSGTRDTEAARVLVSRHGCVMAPHPWEVGAVAVYSAHGWECLRQERIAAARPKERRARPAVDDFDWEGAILARQSFAEI
jgi:hypothetical protein